MKIGDNNFLEPHELKNQKDPGYFGKGFVSLLFHSNLISSFLHSFLFKDLFYTMAEL